MSIKKNNKNEIIQFKNQAIRLGDILSKIVTVQKDNTISIKDRFLRSESYNYFRCGSLRTKKISLKQFNIIVE